MDQLLHTVNRQWFSQNIYIVVKCNLYILSGYSEILPKMILKLYGTAWMWKHAMVY